MLSKNVKCKNNILVNRGVWEMSLQEFVSLRWFYPEGAFKSFIGIQVLLVLEINLLIINLLTNQLFSGIQTNNNSFNKIKL